MSTIWQRGIEPTVESRLCLLTALQEKLATDAVHVRFVLQQIDALCVSNTSCRGRAQGVTVANLGVTTTSRKGLVALRVMPGTRRARTACWRQSRLRKKLLVTDATRFLKSRTLGGVLRVFVQ